MLDPTSVSNYSLTCTADPIPDKDVLYKLQWLIDNTTVSMCCKSMWFHIEEEMGSFNKQNVQENAYNIPAK